MTEEQKSSGSMLVPVSIVVAGVLIAGAVIFSSSGSEGTVALDDADADPPSAVAGLDQPSTDKVRPFGEGDHIKGSPDAELVIYEYSDLDCPYCKQYHTVMNQIEQVYAGKVAVVHRHFPLEMHPTALPKALLTECVYEQGGDDAFWSVVDELYALPDYRSQEELQQHIDEFIPAVIAGTGYDVAEIELCMEEGRFLDKIQSDLDNAIATGGRGTPWSVVVKSDGTTHALNGYRDFDGLKEFIDPLMN